MTVKQKEQLMALEDKKIMVIRLWQRYPFCKEVTFRRFNNRCHSTKNDTGFVTITIKRDICLNRLKLALFLI